MFLPIGNERIDRILQGLLDLFEMAFPGRVRSAYLVGSQAAGPGGATPSSDVDVRIVFRGDFLPGELDRFYKVRQAVRALCPLGIDCPPLSEARLQTEDWQHEVIGLKTMSHLLWGEDLRGTLPDLGIEAFTRNVSAAPLRFICEAHKIKSPLPYPLDFPDPRAEFFGYNVSDMLADLPEGSLKLLVQIVGLIATSRLAIEMGHIVGRKEDWLPAYQKYIHDGWTTYLEEIYTCCKREWQYRIPRDAEKRSSLRKLCQQTLDFENDYLIRYQDYLKQELESDDLMRQEFARKRLSELAF